MHNVNWAGSVRAGFLFLMFAAAGCGGGGAAEPVIPDPVGYEYRVPAATSDGWQVGNAAEQGVAVAQLVAAMDAIGRGEFPVIDSIAIARNGKLVFEETIRTTTDAEDSRVGNADPALHAQFSATKSITAIAAGIAIDEGYIDGVATPFLDLFPYASYDNWDERKRDITVGNVLAMHLGLAWNEWDPPYSSGQNQLIRFYAEEFDYSKSLLDLPVVADPGTAFAYNTIATIALAQAIENAGPLSFVDFGLVHLVQPLGISRVEFLTTPTGLPNAGGGFYFMTRDMVKFGQLMLDGGSWNTQRIVSEQWVAEMVEKRTSMSWPDSGAWDWQLDGYGYQWWLGHYDVDGVRHDTWVMWGFGGQWVVVVPSLSLVIGVNSHGYDDSDLALNQAHALIRRYVLPGLE